MQARVLTTVLVAAVLGAGCSAEAGADAVPSVGILRSLPVGAEVQHAFEDALADGGFEPGRDVGLLAREEDVVQADLDAAAEQVRAWVDDGVDVIVAMSTPLAEVASRNADHVPVLFLSSYPLRSGLVDDLVQPGGRMTGVAYRPSTARTLDLARRLVPDLERVGLLVPEDDAAAPPHTGAVSDGAEELGLELTIATFGATTSLTAAVSTLATAGAQAIYMSQSTGTARVADEIVDEAAAHGLPVVANFEVTDRAVLTFVPDFPTAARQLGSQVARVLAGADPGSLPVEEPQRFAIHLNVDQARALGIEPPAALIRAATRVIGDVP